MGTLGFKKRLGIYMLALSLGLAVPFVMRGGEDQFAVDTDELSERQLGFPSAGRELGTPQPDGDESDVGRLAMSPAIDDTTDVDTVTAPDPTPATTSGDDATESAASSSSTADAPDVPAPTSPPNPTTPPPAPTTPARPTPPPATAVPTTTPTATTPPPTTPPPTTAAPKTNATADAFAFGTFTDWPIRNTSLDSRTQFVDTPAAQLDWRQFTEPSDRSIALGAVAANKQLGQFRTQCSFSHYAYDDPLVAPGRPGASHLHMYFGNTEANANSTYRSLRDSGSSTCNGLEGNRTGYWIPAVFDGGGNARIPSRIEVYYKSHDGAFNNVVKPPEGLGIVAGTAVQWGCQEGGAQGQNLNRPVQQRQNTIPRCSNTATLLAHLQFPQCLSGTVGPNTGNATSQMQYPTRGFFTNSCPPGTQYTTAIEYFIAWAPEDHDGNTDQWWLSSDVRPDGSRAPNGSTLHGDWFGGWNPELMDQITQNCIARLAECSWDLVADNLRLTQVEHFGPRHPTAYGGRRAVPAQELSESLCPTDTYTRPSDAANCDSRK